MASDYDAAIRRVHDLGIMINASFVFGLDDDDPSVFDRTVEWAVSQSIETATFHIMTPYPGTALHDRVAAEGRITDTDWDHYDTRHVVYRPLRMTPLELLAGYRRAYRSFYSWSSILRGAAGQRTVHQKARHLTYAGGWKRFEPLWDAIIRSRRVSAMLPLLETTLDAFGRARRAAGRSEPSPDTADGTVEAIRRHRHVPATGRTRSVQDRVGSRPRNVDNAGPKVSDGRSSRRGTNG